MEYKIESIGSAFNKKQIEQLTATLNGRSREGFLFHSVFEVTDPGCLGIGQSRTYLAVYVRQNAPHR